MITWIGFCAGEIWRYLDKHEKASLKSLYANLTAPKETVLMAVGWLAREGYVIVDGKLPDFTVKLNANPPKKS